MPPVVTNCSWQFCKNQWYEFWLWRFLFGKWSQCDPGKFFFFFIGLLWFFFCTVLNHEHSIQVFHIRWTKHYINVDYTLSLWFASFSTALVYPQWCSYYWLGFRTILDNYWYCTCGLNDHDLAQWSLLNLLGSMAPMTAHPICVSTWTTNSN